MTRWVGAEGDKVVEERDERKEKSHALQKPKARISMKGRCARYPQESATVENLHGKIREKDFPPPASRPLIPGLALGAPLVLL